MMEPTLTIVIPLWNEEKNIVPLIEMFEKSELHKLGLRELILVNNGSLDKTGSLIDELAKQVPWIVPIHLSQNLNYGGGIQRGLAQATGDYVGFIPGDLQIDTKDVSSVWLILKEQLTKGASSRLLVKGCRTIRRDGVSTRFVSTIYTWLANLILGIWVRDINGLPKIFHRELLSHLPQERVRTFVFDAQILLTAKKLKWPIIEIPVVFHARREGVSSWSGRRLKVYFESFKLLFKIRKLELGRTMKE